MLRRFYGRRQGCKRIALDGLQLGRQRQRERWPLQFDERRRQHLGLWTMQVFLYGAFGALHLCQPLRGNALRLGNFLF